MALAETMAEINPTLQKFVSFQIEKEKQKGILEGRNKVLGSTPEEINKLKKELEIKKVKDLLEILLVEIFIHNTELKNN